MSTRLLLGGCANFLSSYFSAQSSIGRNSARIGRKAEVWKVERIWVTPTGRSESCL
jgi:hypothetical protein